jgi:succinate-semialdehyde dehydrogenase/glutarate-semialdehyde dehydrogenase
VTLTGSERAGMSVAATAGHALKKSVLELGGSDPFIVLPSADLDAAVQTAVTARVQNNGQSCIAAKRFIVVEAVADEFLERFTQAMDALVVGDPFDPATQVGPIVTEAQRAELVGQIEEARSQGAVVHGGTALDGPGWYLTPAVLSGVTADMPVAQEEIFGPVAIVERVPDLTAAIEVANSTTFGLGSSVWTNDEAEQRRCIEEIEAGAVFVNAMVVSTPELPFGGIKRSGFGRELSELGLKEFTNAKTVWIT